MSSDEEAAPVALVASQSFSPATLQLLDLAMLDDVVSKTNFGILSDDQQCCLTKSNMKLSNVGQFK